MVVELSRRREGDRGYGAQRRVLAVRRRFVRGVGTPSSSIEHLEGRCFRLKVLDDGVRESLSTGRLELFELVRQPRWVDVVGENHGEDTGREDEGRQWTMGDSSWHSDGTERRDGFPRHLATAIAIRHRQFRLNLTVKGAYTRGSEVALGDRVLEYAPSLSTDSDTSLDRS